ncbi:MAG: hypothetical protein L0Y56_14190, partial [Nitrospira sp.]|nr:hypothetical protein [Nitrospira sp.]
MSTYAEKLLRLRRQEQESRGYATSSRWYIGLSNAIAFLERAETADDPLERFRDAWSSAYNLFMMQGSTGDDELKRFNNWVSEVVQIPGVRSQIQEPSFTHFKESVKEARKALLYDTEKKRPREGYQALEAWDGKATDVDQSIRYFLTIIRNIRNACDHPEFNPNAKATKKALASAADCLIPMVAAAIQVTIEHPVEGTTGRTTAYRSFLWPFLKNSDSFFSDYYLERLFPEEELETFPEDPARDRLKGIARQLEANRSILVTTDADETRQKWCEPVLFSTLGVHADKGIRIIAEEGVFEPSYVLTRVDLSGKPQEEYRGKEAGRDLVGLIWVLPWRTSLDAVSTDPAFEALPIMEIAHRALTHSDVPWAVLTNGQQFRLLSKGTAHKPRCFLEIDLAAMLDRHKDAEALLAFRYFLGLFSGSSFIEKDDQDHTRLDRVVIGSERHGKEIGDELKENVYDALEELGDGFLHYLHTHLDNLEAWRRQKAPSSSIEELLVSDQLLTEIYHESLSLMYRL